jgi:hypothetical protein
LRVLQWPRRISQLRLSRQLRSALEGPKGCGTKKLERTLSAGKAGYRQLFHHFPKTIFQFVPQKISPFNHKTLPLSHFQTKSQNENRSHRGNDKFWRPCCNRSMNDNLPSTRGQARPKSSPNTANLMVWGAHAPSRVAVGTHAVSFFRVIYDSYRNLQSQGESYARIRARLEKNPALRVEEGSPAISRHDPYGTLAAPSPGRGRSAARDGGGIGKIVSTSQSSLIKANQDIKRTGGVGMTLSVRRHARMSDESSIARPCRATEDKPIARTQRPQSSLIKVNQVIFAGGKASYEEFLARSDSGVILHSLFKIHHSQKRCFYQTNLDF